MGIGILRHGGLDDPNPHTVGIRPNVSVELPTDYVNVPDQVGFLSAFPAASRVLALRPS